MLIALPAPQPISLERRITDVKSIYRNLCVKNCILQGSLKHFRIKQTGNIAHCKTRAFLSQEASNSCSSNGISIICRVSLPSKYAPENFLQDILSCNSLPTLRQFITLHGTKLNSRQLATAIYKLADLAVYLKETESYSENRSGHKCNREEQQNSSNVRLDNSTAIIDRQPNHITPLASADVQIKHKQAQGTTARVVTNIDTRSIDLYNGIQNDGLQQINSAHVRTLSTDNIKQGEQKILESSNLKDVTEECSIPNGHEVSLHAASLASKKGAMAKRDEHIKAEAHELLNVLVNLLQQPHLLRALKPRSIADVLWACAKFRVSPPAIILETLYGSSKNASSLPGPAFIKLVSSMAMLPQPPMNVPQEFSSEMLSAVPDLVKTLAPSQLAMLAWSLARLGWQPASVWVQPILSFSGVKLAPLNPMELANLVCALGIARVYPCPDRFILGALARLSPHLKQLQPPQRISVLWAAARLQLQPPISWMESFLAATHADVDCISPTTLGHLIWSLARLRWAPSTPWMAAFMKQVQATYFSSSPATTSLILWSLATLRYRPVTSLLRRLLFSIAPGLGSSEGTTVSMLLLALRPLSWNPPRKFRDSILQLLLDKAQIWSPKVLATSLKAIIDLRWPLPETWLNTLMTRLAASFPTMEPATLSTLLWSVARHLTYAADSAQREHVQSEGNVIAEATEKRRRDSQQKSTAYSTPHKRLRTHNNSVASTAENRCVKADGSVIGQGVELERLCSEDDFICNSILHERLHSYGDSVASTSGHGRVNLYGSYVDQSTEIKQLHSEENSSAHSIADKRFDTDGSSIAYTAGDRPKSEGSFVAQSSAKAHLHSLDDSLAYHIPNQGLNSEESSVSISPEQQSLRLQGSSIAFGTSSKHHQPHGGESAEHKYFNSNGSSFADHTAHEQLDSKENSLVYHTPNQGLSSEGSSPFLSVPDQGVYIEGGSTALSTRPKGNPGTEQDHLNPNGSSLAYNTERRQPHSNETFVAYNTQHKQLQPNGVTVSYNTGQERVGSEANDTSNNAQQQCLYMDASLVIASSRVLSHDSSSTQLQPLKAGSISEENKLLGIGNGPNVNHSASTDQHQPLHKMTGSISEENGLLYIGNGLDVSHRASSKSCHLYSGGHHSHNGKCTCGQEPLSAGDGQVLPFPTASSPCQCQCRQSDVESIDQQVMMLSNGRGDCPAASTTEDNHSEGELVRVGDDEKEMSNGAASSRRGADINRDGHLWREMECLYDEEVMANGNTDSQDVTYRTQNQQHHFKVDLSSDEQMILNYGTGIHHVACIPQDELPHQDTSLILNDKVVMIGETGDPRVPCSTLDQHFQPEAGTATDEKKVLSNGSGNHQGACSTDVRSLQPVAVSVTNREQVLYGQMQDSSMGSIPKTPIQPKWQSADSSKTVASKIGRGRLPDMPWLVDWFQAFEQVMGKADSRSLSCVLYAVMCVYILAKGKPLPGTRPARARKATRLTGAGAARTGARRQSTGTGRKQGVRRRPLHLGAVRAGRGTQSTGIVGPNKSREAATAREGRKLPSPQRASGKVLEAPAVPSRYDINRGTLGAVSAFLPCFWAASAPVLCKFTAESMHMTALAILMGRRLPPLKWRAQFLLRASVLDATMSSSQRATMRRAARLLHRYVQTSKRRFSEPRWYTRARRRKQRKLGMNAVA